MLHERMRFGCLADQINIISLLGLGFGLCLIPSLSSVQIHFRACKHQFVAVSLVQLGTVLGLFAFPTLFTTLIHEYGWRGSMLITAAIIAHHLPCAAIFSSNPAQETAITSTNATSTSHQHHIEHLEPVSYEEVETDEAKKYDKEAFPENAIEKSKVDLVKESSARQDAIQPVYMECNLRRCYYVLFLGSWMLHTSSTAVYVILVDHIVSQGVTLERALPVLLTLSLGNLLGRLACPLAIFLITKYSCKITRPNYKYCIFCISLSGIAIALMGVTPVMAPNGLILYHIYSFLFGCGFGGNMAAYPNLVLELFGSQGFARTMSHSLFCGTFGALLSSPLAGVLYDLTYTYQVSLILISVCVISSTMPIVLGRRIAMTQLGQNQLS